MPSVKYFTDPGSRFVKHPASQAKHLGAMVLPNSECRGFVIFWLVTKKTLYFFFLWGGGGGGATE